MSSRSERRRRVLAALPFVLALSSCVATAPGAPPSSAAPGPSDAADPMPSPSPNAPTPPTGDPMPPAPTLTAVRIAAGATAAYTDPSGQAWSADSSFAGGVTDTSATPVTIAGTDASPLYNGERYGAAASFSYSIAVPNGTWNVRLGFAELYVQAAGQRLFNVSINGSAALTGFDIFAAAGAMNTAVVRSFPVTVTNGQVMIVFDPGAVQNPKVNTIEVVPATSGDGGS